MKIHSIFPDKWFAKLIMTTLKKESIDSEVTKEDLLPIAKLQGSNHFIKDITGIGYLTNLEYVKFKLQSY
ncbi:hypothetical protein AZF37_08555 [endosymbiont 'TC1' of Trimyema compressum]|uniref:internalin N-terminal domain-containing protein n=1 Tax=endosymbiont 'TC1' of Trimyema compressum TaxID=243899 RepID=UPI0007F05498|nr:hypothetical protein [endosymbiont 'TC1' of Trimyema compressum]AMP21197.1 hypothetical protein AZF37_08555 [endosymbiont 'TC1' of Trimyema compressum]